MDRKEIAEIPDLADEERHALDLVDMQAFRLDAALHVAGADGGPLSGYDRGTARSSTTAQCPRRLPEAAWQRCIVHWYRNIFSHVPSTKVREIAAMLKAIHAGEDIAAARQKAVQVIEKLRGLRLTNAAELVAAAIEETLAYYAFPEEHWRRIRTNNPLERILREIRRRTRVVGAFPDGQSALNLAAARLRHIAGTAWSTKRYLNIELLRDQQMRGAITA
jgi:transposase-like protein